MNSMGMACDWQGNPNMEIDMNDLEQMFHELVRKHTDIDTHTIQNLDLRQEHYYLRMELTIAKSQIDWMVNALELLDNHGLIFRKKDELELAREVDAKKEQEAA